MLLKLRSPRCDKCGRSSEDIEQFSDIYRQYEVKHGRRNPGNLCGQCAGDETAARLYFEAKQKLRPRDPGEAKKYDEALRKLEARVRKLH